jgi:hypothetical protein
MASLTEAFLYFSQSFQEYAGIVFHIAHDLFFTRFGEIALRARNGEIHPGKGNEGPERE